VEYGSTPELSIVIPTVDALSERTRRCVQALRAHTETTYEAVIVDNHSPPQGYTAPVNTGIRATSGAYVAVMNDDVEVMKGWWPPLKLRLDEGALLSFPKTAGFHRSDLSGWCFALSREAIEQVSHARGELFDPQFKVWYQDMDLLLRLCQLGQPPIVAEESTISHGLSRTLEGEHEELRSWAKRQADDDRVLFRRKWPGGRRGEPARSLLALLPEPFELP
jgi:GT2 family glycosyltransferase